MNSLPGLNPNFQHDFFHDGCPESDVQRFTPLFQSVWSRVPESCRKDIIRFWSNEDTPQIVLSNDKLDDDCRGFVASDGHQVNYSNAYIRRMVDDEVAMTLIAHEIAHVWQHVTGAWQSFDKRFQKPLAEEDVHVILNDWGFDNGNLFVWEWDNLSEIEKKQIHLSSTTIVNSSF